jgi:Mg/Co/Ni transporter MgtE
VTLLTWFLVDLPKQQLNATVSILILLIKLVASYLGLQLPFVLHGSPIKPLVRALPGTAAAAK